jgi:hypothetical protein
VNTTEIPKKLTCLYWSEIDKWVSTAGLLRFGKLPSAWQLLPVYEFATQTNEKEIVESHIEYRMAGVRWYGEGVFHRETVSGKEQSAKHLYPLKPGCFIYNRLFAWKESFAVVPENFEGFYVSSEFPQFEINKDIVLAEYVSLLFTSKKIIRAVNAASIGSAAISRNRFKESEFLSFKVPIPPMPIQKHVVEYWETAIKQRASAESALLTLIDNLHMKLVEQTQAYKHIAKSKVIVAIFSKTKQWDVKAGRAAAFISANPDFVRLGDYTEECTETVRPREDPEKEWPIYGVNNKEGVFLSTKQIGSKFNVPYKRITKDWLFHNPTRANVGSLGIVPEVPDDAITSPEYQVWRLKSGYLPDFMALMIRTDYFLSLVAFNRVGGVKQRMYYGNLAEIRLPMVDLKIQQHYAEQRQMVLDRISNANAMLKQRKREIEKMILGVKSVEDI